MDATINLKIDSEELDELIKKIGRLVELLNEAQQIIESITYEEQLEA